MKIRRFLLCGLTGLLIAGIAIAVDPGNNFHPPPTTVHEVVQALKDQMPQGWSVTYDQEDAVIEITRDREIMAESTLPNQGMNQKAERVKFSFALRLVPFVSKEAWRKLKAENQHTQKKVQAMFDELSHNLPYKGDDFVGTDDESKKKIAEYERLKGEWHDLPGFYFHDVGLAWTSLDPDIWGFYPYSPVDDGVFRECQGVIKKIEGVLSTY